ncbi:hypothetical protein ACFLIM_40030 [Nonomuraea sp. M3C6]|uniref:Uncharacterized protein n=1 Tax=Nonomuraea marmarensis TaxID=3351344 RepID=A0ABW7APS2_9ACTN
MVLVRPRAGDIIAKNYDRIIKYLFHVDLAPLLSQDLDAGQVEILKVRVGLDRLIGVDADRLDAEGHQRGRLARVRDDPRRGLVRLDYLAGPVGERPWAGGCGGGRGGVSRAATREHNAQGREYQERTPCAHGGASVLVLGESRGK